MNRFILLHDSFNIDAGELEVLSACEERGLTKSERWLFATERGKIVIDHQEHLWSRNYENDEYYLEVMVCAAFDDTAAVEYRLRFDDEPIK